MKMTVNPTISATTKPSMLPSKAPSANPTGNPTVSQSVSPSVFPSISPSVDPSTAPSLSPTNFPSNLPSLIPPGMPNFSPIVITTFSRSHVPSIIATDDLTITPSLSLADLPSSIPSRNPSAYPTILPSVPPSLLPSLLPSGYPTTVPSSLPSEYPTTLPSLVPSLFPTFSPQCFPDDDGIYGSSSESQIVVKFGYELETSSGNVQNKIIPSLEKSFSEAILPELFSGKCSSQPDRFRHRLRKLAAVGVSSTPSDTILDNILCEEKTSEDNACNVVRGEFTIFTDGDGEGIEGRVIQKLKEGISNGNFVAVHEGIERISYVQLDAKTNTINSGEGTNIRSDLSGDSYVLYGVITGVVVGFIALALLVWALKKRAKAGDEDEASFEKSEGDIEASGLPAQNTDKGGFVHQRSDVAEQTNIVEFHNESSRAGDEEETTEDDAKKKDPKEQSDGVSVITDKMRSNNAEEPSVEGENDEEQHDHKIEEAEDKEQNHVSTTIDNIHSDNAEEIYVEEENESTI